MKFSVVTPVLNGAKFLNAAIESVRAQEDRDWEMIIIDGQSDDDSVEIAKQHAQEDKRIAIASEPDDGMYDGLIKGIEATTGEWICWLNSDDLYTPWCFSTLRSFTSRKASKWVTGYPSCWDKYGRLCYVRVAGLYNRRLIKAGWHHAGLLGNLQQESIFFKRSLFDKLSTNEISQIRSMRYAGDFLLWRFLAKHAQLEAIPSVLGGFRRHAANMSYSHKATYENEIKSTRPFFLPHPLSATVAYLYRLASLRRSLKLEEDASLQLESFITENM